MCKISDLLFFVVVVLSAIWGHLFFVLVVCVFLSASSCLCLSQFCLLYVFLNVLSLLVLSLFFLQLRCDTPFVLVLVSVFALFCFCGIFVWSLLFVFSVLLVFLFSSLCVSLSVLFFVCFCLYIYSTLLPPLIRLSRCVTRGRGCSSVGRASNRHAVDAGSISRRGKGFSSQSLLSVQTLLPVSETQHSA